MQLNINEIMNILPHRYPFLLVDKVEEINLSKSIRAIKNITVNEPQFVGHFPEKPVMPGVLIVEAMAQTAAILVAKSIGGSEKKDVLFLSIDNTKFRKIVSPGDSLVMTVEIVHNRGHVWKCRAKSQVEGILVAESTFTAMIQDKKI
ncbi:MAG: hypothetical protein DGJ47_000675 [Rickettsiaceae bacterium]